MNDESTTPSDDELTWPEVIGWLEFGCWTTLALTPMLYFVNGPAVSTDQLVVRIGLVCVASLGAIALTGRRLFLKTRTRRIGKR